MKRDIKELINKAKSLDWRVTEVENGEYEFSRYSPKGQDFNMYVVGSNSRELINSIYDNYENYDVSEATYIWLDNTGHGKNGAPYDMKDLYEDMEACKQMILDLYNAITI